MTAWACRDGNRVCIVLFMSNHAVSRLRSTVRNMLLLLLFKIDGSSVLQCRSYQEGRTGERSRADVPQRLLETGADRSVGTRASRDEKDCMANSTSKQSTLSHELTPLPQGSVKSTASGMRMTDERGWSREANSGYRQQAVSGTMPTNYCADKITCGVIWDDRTRYA